MKLPRPLVMLTLLPSSDAVLLGSEKIVEIDCIFHNAIFFIHFFMIFQIFLVSLFTRFETRLNCATYVFLGSVVIL